MSRRKQLNPKALLREEMLRKRASSLKFNNVTAVKMEQTEEAEDATVLTNTARSPALNNGHAPSNVFVCPHCPTTEFTSNADLATHISQDHSASFACGLCDAAFQQVADLQRHTLRAHSLTDLESAECHVCHVCDSSFQGSVDLVKHVICAHPGVEYDFNPATELTCEPCKKTFSDPRMFLEHEALPLHGTARPAAAHACPDCGNTFPNEAGLDGHVIQAHYMRKQSEFVCGACTKSCPQPDELQKHLLEVHALQVYRCSLCNNLFNSRVEIQVHFAMQHSDEVSRFFCRICTDVGPFEHKADFRAHVEAIHLLRPLADSALATPPRIPTPEFACTVCTPQRRFRREADLNQHTERCHQLKAYVCRLCCRSFDVQFLYEEHMLSCHRHLEAQLPTARPPSSGYPYFPPFASNPFAQSPAEATLGQISLNHQSNPITKCNICDERCETHEELAVHKTRHCRIGKADTCQTCRESLDSVEQFYSHTRRHMGQQGITGLTCIVCKQSLTSATEIRVHAKFHLQKNVPETSSSPPSSCLSCGVSVSPSTIYCNICQTTVFEAKTPQKRTPSRTPSASSRTETPKTTAATFECMICQTPFATELEIQQHVLSSHQGTQNACLICETVLETPSRLQCHLIEHSFNGRAEFECYICGCVFTMSHALQSHMLKLHGFSERPYECTQTDCNMRFFFSAELDNHVRLHATRPVVSPAVSTPSSLSRNGTPNVLQLKPIQGDRQTYDCPYCPKSFASLSALQGHSHVHMDCSTRRPYACPKCEKTFNSNTKLRNHVRLHDDNKPYECTACKRTFSRRDNLKVHMRTHEHQTNVGKLENGDLPTMVQMETGTNGDVSQLIDTLMDADENGTHNGLE